MLTLKLVNAILKSLVLRVPVLLLLLLLFPEPFELEAQLFVLLVQFDQSFSEVAPFLVHSRAIQL